jgi:hypothetical protein
MKRKFQSVWSEALVTLSHHIPGGTEENYEKIFLG